MKPAGQMSITLTPALEKLVRDEVERGTYASSSEVIREALRERYKRQKLDELDAALERGIADIAAGRSMPVAQAFTHVRSKLGLKRRNKRR
ncbi:MAG: type II toxin-antitoxin system ParD family antitoxin [Xanthobacteraceae bacterium]|nr:type II toxin-antitoxin system ParD family antitoxin [Xanthobacteraceae bacterium]